MMICCIEDTHAVEGAVANIGSKGKSFHLWIDCLYEVCFLIDLIAEGNIVQIFFFSISKLYFRCFDG